MFLPCPTHEDQPRRLPSVAGRAPLSFLPSIPSPRQILQAHALLILLGLARSRSAMGHLLAACAISSFPLPTSYTRAIFNQIEIPNVFACNNFIRCLARSAAPAEAAAVYRRMRRQGVPTNNYTFPFLLHSFLEDLPAGSQLHAHIFKLGHHGDVFVRNGLVHFYGLCRLMSCARKVFDEMPQRRDLVTWNAFIAGYARLGQVGACEKLFWEMPQRDAVSWSALIMGLVQAGSMEKALAVFGEMAAHGPLPNEATIVTVLSAAAQLGLLERGRAVHAAVQALNLPVSVNVATALIDMYAKCGCISSSRAVFEGMPQRDVFLWNAMICGLAAHGLAGEALQLFERFMDLGLAPNSITFVGVLNACSRAGLVEEGRRQFSAMTELHKIEPEMEHYGCLVDLLARAGLVQEALELVSRMDKAPDPVLWGTLLGACKTHKLFDLGAQIGNRLIDLEPSHDGHFVLLSGVYAMAGRWEEVRRVRQQMGAGKVAGWSAIEAEGKVHRFVAGDREHERWAEIQEKLGEMERRLMEAGYRPDVAGVLHDIAEEEKEMAVREHSERLAMAFGMMVVEEGRAIRIVKNLRVCGDCHDVTKMVSAVFRREIIVRDGSRFHHFNAGSCSCGDFW
ncbi:pentatricopeptide repeat-containing protein At5g06540-like [Wolffia australiana]